MWKNLSYINRFLSYAVDILSYHLIRILDVSLNKYNYIASAYLCKKRYGELHNTTTYFLFDVYIVPTLEAFHHQRIHIVYRNINIIYIYIYIYI